MKLRQAGRNATLVACGAFALLLAWTHADASESAAGNDVVVHALALLGGRAFRLSESPTAHPAHSSRLTRACGPGWFAVGDAAASFDPLSSYGIGSALGTGFYAAQAIVSAWAGEATSLEAYRYLIDSRYPHYLDRLRERYQAVSRWPDAPFWERRRRQDLGVPLQGEAGPESAELLRSGRLLVFPTPEN